MGAIDGPMSELAGKRGGGGLGLEKKKESKLVEDSDGGRVRGTFQFGDGHTPGQSNQAQSSQQPTTQHQITQKLLANSILSNFHQTQLYSPPRSLYSPAMSGERRQINTSNTKWRAAFLLSFCSSPRRDYTDVKVDFSSWIAARYPSEPRPSIGLYRLVSACIGSYRADRRDGRCLCQAEQLRLPRRSYRAEHLGSPTTVSARDRRR